MRCGAHTAHRLASTALARPFYLHDATGTPHGMPPSRCLLSAHTAHSCTSLPLLLSQPPPATPVLTAFSLLLPPSLHCTHTLHLPTFHTAHRFSFCCFATMPRVNISSSRHTARAPASLALSCTTQQTSTTAWHISPCHYALPILLTDGCPHTPHTCSSFSCHKLTNVYLNLRETWPSLSERSSIFCQPILLSIPC